MLQATKRTGRMGTPQYSAPEQVDSEKYGKTDWRTDIWQIGCILYEMITGEPPFKGETLMEVAINILQKEPKKPENIPEQLCG